MRPADPSIPVHARTLTPHATWLGTAILVCFTLGSYGLLTMGEMATPSDSARFIACGIGIGLILSVAVDYMAQGIRELFRADMICIFALYFLTLVEFLFEQPEFDETVTHSAVHNGLFLVVIAISIIALGRHLFPPRVVSLNDTSTVRMSTIFKLLVLSAALGLLYRLISVQFNPVALVDAMTGPRFAVPWARGRLGNWTALLSELELMLYLIPPLFAVIWTRRNQLSGTQVGIAAFLFLFTLFSGFCSGTRNVFAVYLSTFVVSYALSSYRRSIKSLIIISVAATGILIVASYFMLEFRRSGLQHYLSNESYHDDSARDTLFIDYNLLAISELTTVFPQNHDFIGLELPISALARPVPRALWPGKPEGLSITIEDALGAEGFTVATTFIGESYMAGGTFGVVLAALFFASLASWWNRFCTAASSSAIVSVIYASGFFALAISMRSLLMFTTAILPTIALMVLTSMFTPSSTTRRNRKPANLPSHRAAEISRTQR